jgi:hypothetical protein
MHEPRVFQEDRVLRRIIGIEPPPIYLAMICTDRIGLNLETRILYQTPDAMLVRSQKHIYALRLGYKVYVSVQVENKFTENKSLKRIE